MAVLTSGTMVDKMRFTINEEISVYINLVIEKAFEHEETNDFIIQTVVPRFNKLRDILTEYELQEAAKKQAGAEPQVGVPAQERTT